MKTIICILSIALCTVQASAITYSTWIASYGLTGDDAAASADPDLDGLTNLQEYAFTDLNPTVATSYAAASLPRPGFARRTGAALGSWEWSDTLPTNGLGGVWHFAVRYTLRADIEGVRITPQISKDMVRWFGGRGAVRVTTISGPTKMAVAVTKGNRFRYFFGRVRVQ